MALYKFRIIIIIISRPNEGRNETKVQPGNVRVTPSGIIWAYNIICWYYYIYSMGDLLCDVSNSECVRYGSRKLSRVKNANTRDEMWSNVVHK